MIVEPPAVASVMAIAAHPDDIESWCAGTLVRLIDVGATARLLLVTSGDQGSRDPQATLTSVAAMRETEAQEAALALGLSAVSFLRYPDGNVENTQGLRGELVAWIRRWQQNGRAVSRVHWAILPLRLGSLRCSRSLTSCGSPFADRRRASASRWWPATIQSSSRSIVDKPA